MRSTRREPDGRARRRPAGGSGRRDERACTRAGCLEPAVGTLTYVYAASTAVLGPLAAYSEPHTYDLCLAHARGLTTPRGWQLVRHDGELAPHAPEDDLVALADAVREAGQPPMTGAQAVVAPDPDGPPARRGGRLRLVRPDRPQ